MLSDLLDMPTERADELRDWSQAITLSLEPIATEDDLGRKLVVADGKPSRTDAAEEV